MRRGDRSNLLIAILQVDKRVQVLIKLLPAGNLRNHSSSPHSTTAMAHSTEKSRESSATCSSFSQVR